MAVTLAVALATALFQLPFFDRFFSAMDEGHVLLFADMIASGSGMLYRDATSYPLPGAFYLLAGAFRLFEPSILLARWIVLLEFSLFAALWFALMRRLLPLGGALLAVGVLWIYRVWAFPHWQMYSYSSTALVVLLGSVLFVLRYAERGRRVDLLLAGLVFGLGVYCKQDYGAAHLLAIGTALAVLARTRDDLPGVGATLLSFLAPAAGVGALAGLHLLWQGQLAFVVQLTVLNHFEGLSEYAYEAFPPLLPLLGQDPALRTPVGINNLFPSIVAVVHGLEVQRSAWFRETALYDAGIKLLIFGPRLLAAAAAFWIWRRRAALRDPARRDRAFAALLLTALAATTALLSAIYRPQDYLHLLVLYAPFLMLGLLLVHDVTRGRRGLRLALVLPFVAVAAYSGWLALSLRNVFSEPIPHPRAGVFVKPEEAALLGELTDYVARHSAPGDTVAAMPYFPLVLFLAERVGPHAASYIVWPFPEYADRDRRIVDAMEARGTDLVIYNYTQFPHFPPFSEYAPELWQYLFEHFRLERVFNEVAFGYTLGALSRAAPEPGRRLDTSPDRTSLRIESPGGAVREVPAARRGELLREEVWPFREVLALRPGQRGRTVLSIPAGVVSPGTRLSTAVGVHPRAWFRHPPSVVQFAVFVRVGETRSRVWQRGLNPHLVLADRGWFEVDVPLGEHAGREVTVELACDLEGAPMPPEDAALMCGWALPRLVEASEDGDTGRDGGDTP